MDTKVKTKITVQTAVNAPLDKVWKRWTSPEDIVNWNAASETWHTPRAVNDLQKGGRFTCRMEAKDGSFGFDFGGVYTNIITNRLIEYTLGDDRKVSITFDVHGKEIKITETFEAEDTNPIEMQRGGWQAILDNFKRYVEENQ